MRVPDPPIQCPTKQVPRPHRLCCECFYYAGVTGIDGECRRRSPLPTQIAENDMTFSGSTTHARWPVVRQSHWCGESKTKMMTVRDEGDKIC